MSLSRESSDVKDAATAPRAPARREARESFYRRLSSQSLAPLWEVMKDLVPPEPAPKMRAHLWRWDMVRSHVLEAGGLVDTEEAERRVLVLENPAFPSQSRATSTLYAGVQLVLPGEIAAAHRHTQSALRFTLESEGGFTTVAGERVPMEPGDFVITPSWSFHDHGNNGTGAVMWLDVLDVPIVSFFEGGFSQQNNSRQQIVARPEGDSVARYGSGLLPMDHESPYGKTSPTFHYRYTQVRKALLAVAAAKLDAYWGASLRYANPLTGGWAMPTISSWMSHLPAGYATAPMRSTDGMIVAVAEGQGTVLVGGERLAFGPKDVFVIPNWTWRSLEADTECFMFCCSDRALQEKIGLWREEKQSRKTSP